MMRMFAPLAWSLILTVRSIAYVFQLVGQAAHVHQRSLLSSQYALHIKCVTCDL